MAKEKLTLTLDATNVAALRDLAGARSLSSGVDDAVAARVAQLRHLAAVDVWLAELETAHGPVPEPLRTWAAGQVEQWDTLDRAPRRTG